MQAVKPVPLPTVEYEMLKECINPYKNIDRINQEKNDYWQSLKQSRPTVSAMGMDTKRTLKLRDVDEE